MMRLSVVLVVACALAAWSTTPPSPQAASADASSFSAMRARPDLDWIAAENHPTGSPANARVRDRLLARLTELGVTGDVERVPDALVHSWNGPDRTTTIENVIARAKGTDPHAAPLLLMAHYDSVPESPGAADDGAGVASLLEIARILRVAPTKHDVVLLFSDGEELGTVGAQQFFALHPLAHEVVGVVNLEARGGAGRANLFEIGARSDDLMRQFSPRSPHTSSTSFAAFVYAHMPNDTDFTISKHAGLPGFNLAFIAEPAQYHTPRATPSALDLGSLQHIGEEALVALRTLDDAELPTHDVGALAWSDVLGQRVVIYGALGGWLVLASTFVLLAIAWARQSVKTPLRGPLFALTLVLLVGVLLFLGKQAALTEHTYAGFFHLIVHDHIYELALFLLALGGSVMAAQLTAARDSVAGAWIALLALALLGAVALQIAVPALTPPLTWPLLLSALACVLFGKEGRVTVGATLVLTVALALTLGWAHLVYLGVGMGKPPLLAVFALTAALSMYPLYAHSDKRLGPALIVVGVVLAAVAGRWLAMS